MLEFQTLWKRIGMGSQYLGKEVPLSATQIKLGEEYVELCPWGGNSI